MIRRTRHDPLLQIALMQEVWGWTPHEGQRRWLLDTSPEKVAAWGRRAGKSDCEAHDVASYSLLFPGSHQSIWAPSNEQTSIIFDPVIELLEQAHDLSPREFPKPQVRNNSHQKSIRLPNDTLIFCLNADENSKAKRKRGWWFDRAICDEAAYMDGDIIDRVVRPMLLDRDGQLVQISSPFGKNHFFDAFEFCRLEYGSAYQMPSTSNPHVPPEALERELKRYGSPEHPTYQAEFLAQFIDNTGLYIGVDMLDPLMTGGNSPLPYDPSRQYVAGVDWGIANDFTVVWVLDVTEPVFRTACIFRGHRFASWAEGHEAVASLAKAYDADLLVDGSDLSGGFVEELVRMGCRVAAVKLNSGAKKKEIIDNLIVKMSNGQLVIPAKEWEHGRLFRDEVAHFAFELTEHGNYKLHAMGEHHDDMIIALALAVYQRDNWGVPAAEVSQVTLAEAVESSRWMRMMALRAREEAADTRGVLWN